MNKSTVAFNPESAVIFYNIRSEPLTHATTWMTLRTGILSEGGQFRTSAHHMNPYLNNVRKYKIIHSNRE